MSHETLTGRRRYRIQKVWRSKTYIVLQVDVSGLSTSHCAGRIDSEWQTYWRDARLEDLSLHEMKLTAIGEPHVAGPGATQTATPGGSPCSTA